MVKLIFLKEPVVAIRLWLQALQYKHCLFRVRRVIPKAGYCIEATKGTRDHSTYDVKVI